MSVWFLRKHDKSFPHKELGMLAALGGVSEEVHAAISSFSFSVNACFACMNDCDPQESHRGWKGAFVP